MAKLHIAMYPWFAAGHFIPYLHLANELAARGHTITLLLPKNSLTRLHHLNLHQGLITFYPITVPHVEGLPPGTETVSDISISQNHELAIAMDLTRDQVERFLLLNAAANKKPDLVVYDFAYWMPDIAKQHGIKSIFYVIVSAAAVAFLCVPARRVPSSRPISEDEVKEPPPGYPSSTVLPVGCEASYLLFLSRPFGEGGISMYHRLSTAMRNSDALAIRTCWELEGKFCRYIETQFQRKALLTGLVLIHNHQPDNNPPLEDRWAKWLDGFELGSVVFCSFGSQYIIEKDQFQELVLGFELTGLPFLVALKPPVGCASVEETLPDGFQDRVGGRGVVYGGWLQQPQILNHPSVGCFVNHCGTGSALESLMSDKQVVLVPRLGDQMLHSKVLADELKVAVKVDKDQNGWISKESLCRAIRSVMDEDSEVGMVVKKNHADLREELEKPGFMSGYIDRFVLDLQQLVNPIG